MKSLVATRIPLPAMAVSFTVALLATVSPGLAEDSVPAQSTSARPLLDQLNRETENLFHEARAGVVRVQLPAPKWINAYTAAPLNRWEKLDPEIRRQVQIQSWVRSAGAVAHVSTTTTGAPPPATRPAEEKKPPAPKVSVGDRAVVFVEPSLEAALGAPRDPVAGGRLQTTSRPPASFQPNNLGIVLDDAGHLLVPLYVEREVCEKSPARVAMDDGQVVEATFVGSDRQTNLTLLQVNNTPGTPVKLASGRPEEGSLVMCLSPTDASGRLSVWTGGAHEYGVIFTVDGHAAGIARYGQFLSGSACKLIADQLIRFGSVKRATLGVIVSEIRQDDPLREQSPALGTRAAMRVDEVISGSAADKAGLRAGDLLVALAGEPVSDIPSFAAAIAARNGPTDLLILRGNETLTVNVDLQQHN